MKECNICKSNCSPKGSKLQNADLCTFSQLDLSRSKFHFSDCISRITISDPNTDIVRWFLDQIRY